MDFRKYRLPIAFVLLAALVVVTIVVVRGQDDEPATPAEGEEGEEAESDLPYQIPEIAENEVTELEIRRPPAEGEEREPPVKLTKRNGHWRVTAPIDAEADESAITTALSKLSGLSVQGVGSANREQIEKVFYRAFTQLLNAGATFSTARAATIQAARDLYGNGSAAERAVSEAWTAVGVN